MITRDKNKGKEYIDTMLDLFEIKPYKKTRSSQQNRALHLFFSMVSDALNEMGLEFTFIGVKGLELQVMYTPLIVKDFLWRPIQKALFDIESTKELTTDQINKILDVIVKFFAEQGTGLTFPSSIEIYSELTKQIQ